MEKKLFMVASDLHGSMIGLNRTLELFNEHHADKLILLGDIFGTNAAEMVEKLNSIANRLTIVKGNNDWYFEPENAKFLLRESAYENINGRLAYLCHGHRLNDMDLNGYGAKIVMIGHVHRPILRVEQGVIFMCPGSIAVPRSGSEKSFALIDDEKICIFNDENELLNELKLPKID